MASFEQDINSAVNGGAFEVAQAYAEATGSSFDRCANTFRSALQYPAQMIARTLLLCMGILAGTGPAVWAQRAYPVEWPALSPWAGKLIYSDPLAALDSPSGVVAIVDPRTLTSRIIGQGTPERRVGRAVIVPPRSHRLADVCFTATEGDTTRLVLARVHDGRETVREIDLPVPLGAEFASEAFDAPDSTSGSGASMRLYAIASGGLISIAVREDEAGLKVASEAFALEHPVVSIVPFRKDGVDYIAAWAGAVARDTYVAVEATVIRAETAEIFHRARVALEDPPWVYSRPDAATVASGRIDDAWLLGADRFDRSAGGIMVRVLVEATPTSPGFADASLMRVQIHALTPDDLLATSDDPPIGSCVAVHGEGAYYTPVRRESTGLELWEPIVAQWAHQVIDIRPLQSRRNYDGVLVDWGTWSLEGRYLPPLQFDRPHALALQGDRWPFGDLSDSAGRGVWLGAGVATTTEQYGPVVLFAARTRAEPWPESYPAFAALMANPNEEAAGTSPSIAVFSLTTWQFEDVIPLLPD